MSKLPYWNSASRKGFKSHWYRKLLIEELDRRLVLNATPVGPELVVAQTDFDDQFLSAVTIGDRGDFLVAWDSVGQDGDGHGVFARAFSRDGAPRGSEFPVNQTTIGDQLFPSVSASPSGRYVVVWGGRRISWQRTWDLCPIVR